MSALLDEETTDDFYTQKITHIQYVPNTDSEVELNTMYNTSKYESLMKKIRESNVEDESVRKFLEMSATRFIEFNYAHIADYYALAPKEIQELMETLGLVIIDYEDAFENGFVKLNDFSRGIYEDAKKSKK